MPSPSRASVPVLELTFQRHDAVVHELARWVRSKAGGVARVEPRGLDHDRNQRSDIWVTLEDKEILLDVSIVHPLAPCYHDLAPDVVVAMAERKKSQKHAAEAAHIRARFYPFVMTTFGGLGKQAMAFLRLLHDSAK